MGHNTSSLHTCRLFVSFVFFTSHFLRGKKIKYLQDKGLFLLIRSWSLVRMREKHTGLLFSVECTMEVHCSGEGGLPSDNRSEVQVSGVGGIVRYDGTAYLTS